MAFYGSTVTEVNTLYLWLDNGSLSCLCWEGGGRVMRCGVMIMLPSIVVLFACSSPYLHYTVRLKSWTWRSTVFGSTRTMRNRIVTASSSWTQLTSAYDWSLVLLFTVSTLGVHIDAVGTWRHSGSFELSYTYCCQNQNRQKLLDQSKIISEPWHSGSNGRTSIAGHLRRCQTRRLPLTVSVNGRSPTVNGNTCHTWIVSVNGCGYKQRKHGVSSFIKNPFGQIETNIQWSMGTV